MSRLRFRPEENNPQITPITQIILEDRDPQTYAIIGAAMEVHRVLGNGFLEPVYQQALAVEFAEREIPFSQEHQFDISYKGKPLACSYRADFVCYGSVIVEVKALKNLSGHEQSQVINYLKAASIETALLINFGQTSLQYRRFVRSMNSPLNPS